MDHLARAFDMERRFFERLSTDRVPSAYGTVYLDTEYRDRFVSNFLCADDDLRGVEAPALMEEADRILGGAGYPHRTVLIRSNEGARLAPVFEDRGYRVERTVFMLHRHEPDRGPTVEVRELPFADVRPLISETYRRQESLPGDVCERFTDQHGKYERVLGIRFFAGGIDGELAGVCELWMDGADALVENVDTLERYRDRGVARSVVLRAIDEARGAGATHIFIAADDDDWPKDLYARLGFDRLGRSWLCIKWPSVET